MELQDRFQLAVQTVQNLPSSGPAERNNMEKLQFYAFYKQATEGPNKKSKPYMIDVVNRAKWEAWNSLGSMSSQDAMQKYINLFLEAMSSANLQGHPDLMQVLNTLRGSPSTPDRPADVSVVTSTPLSYAGSTPTDVSSAKSARTELFPGKIDFSCELAEIPSSKASESSGEEFEDSMSRVDAVPKILPDENKTSNYEQSAAAAITPVSTPTPTPTPQHTIPNQTSQPDVSSLIRAVNVLSNAVSLLSRDLACLGEHQSEMEKALNSMRPKPRTSEAQRSILSAIIQCFRRHRLIRALVWLLWPAFISMLVLWFKASHM